MSRTSWESLDYRLLLHSKLKESWIVELNESWIVVWHVRQISDIPKQTCSNFSRTRNYICTLPYRWNYPTHWLFYVSYRRLDLCVLPRNLQSNRRQLKSPRTIPLHRSDARQSIEASFSTDGSLGKCLEKREKQFCNGGLRSVHPDGRAGDLPLSIAWKHRSMHAWTLELLASSLAWVWKCSAMWKNCYK